jgi:hypothetical protein
LPRQKVVKLQLLDGFFMAENRKKKYSEKYLIDKLIEAYRLRGGISPSKLYLESLPSFPSISAYRKMFGSWSSSLKKAGLPDVPRGGARYGKRNSRKIKIPTEKDLNKRQASLSIRFNILERDNFTCQYCGATPQDGAKLFIDHIVPFSKGGKTHIGNLITSCFACNIGKRDKIILNCPGINKKNN